MVRRAASAVHLSSVRASVPRAMSIVSSFSVAVVAVLGLCGVVVADDVYLKNGRVIRNVETRERDGRLLVSMAGNQLAFPLSLVERVEEKEVTETISLPVRRPGADPAAAPPDETSPSKSPAAGVRTSFKDGELLPKRVRYNNGIDVISYTAPPGMWTWSGRASRERATGQDDDPFAHMDPSKILVGRDADVLYSLVIWPFVYAEEIDAQKEDLARIWLSFARTELREGPMATTNAAREELRRVGAARYSTTAYHHLWKDSNHRQDGMFLLLFPRDYKQQHRFYVLQWFVTYPAALDKPDLELSGFDTVVRSFSVRPVR